MNSRRRRLFTGLRLVVAVGTDGDDADGRTGRIRDHDRLLRQLLLLLLLLRRLLLLLLLLLLMLLMMRLLLLLRRRL